MDEFVGWLQEQTHAEGRNRHNQLEPAHPAEFGDIEQDRVASALDSLGIDRLYGHQTEAISEFGHENLTKYHIGGVCEVKGELRKVWKLTSIFIEDDNI